MREKRWKKIAKILSGDTFLLNLQQGSRKLTINLEAVLKTMIAALCPRDIF